MSRLTSEPKDSEEIYLIAFQTERVMIKGPAFPPAHSRPCILHFMLASAMALIALGILPSRRTVGCLHYRTLTATRCSMLESWRIRQTSSLSGAGSISVQPITQKRTPASLQALWRTFQVIDCRARAIISLVLGTPYLTLGYVWDANAKAEKQKYIRQLPGCLPSTIEDSIFATTGLGISIPLD